MKRRAADLTLAAACTLAGWAAAAIGWPWRLYDNRRTTHSHRKATP